MVCPAAWGHPRLQSGVHPAACMCRYVSLCVCSLVIWRRAMSEQCTHFIPEMQALPMVRCVCLSFTLRRLLSRSCTMGYVRSVMH